jgi:hypothetical protein
MHHTLEEYGVWLHQMNLRLLETLLCSPRFNAESHNGWQAVGEDVRRLALGQQNLLSKRKSDALVT